LRRPRCCGRVYESAGDWPKVAAVYEVMVACTQDPVRRVELLDLLAKIHERRLNISMRRLMPTVAPCA